MKTVIYIDEATNGYRLDILDQVNLTTRKENPETYEELLNTLELWIKNEKKTLDKTLKIA